MKRYLLFSNDRDVFLGGMRDFSGDYDTINECIINADTGWYQIYDTIEKQYIADTTIDV